MSTPIPRRSIESLESPGTHSQSIKSPSSSQNSRKHFPFPKHGSFQRNHPPQRRGSGASIASSIGGALDTAPSTAQEPVNELAHNAIANLNSPPIVRTGLVAHSALATSSTYRTPSARDIPPVTLTNIAHVDASAFRPYLSQVGPLYENFRRAKAAVNEAATTLNDRSWGDSAAGDESVGRPDIRGRSSSQATLEPQSPAASSPPGSPAVGKRPSSAGTVRRRRPSANAPTPLATIPTVYFEENFRLENPRTFDVVSERSDIIPQPQRTEANGSAKIPVTQRKILHTNAILQEKLSWYMDTVEVHLISSIATASTSFFTALSSLKELQSEAEECIAKIKDLRAALQDLDSNMAAGGLEITHLRRRKENLRKLALAIDQLCEVIDEARVCEQLVDKGDLDEATAKIDNLESLIAGGPLTSSKLTSKHRINLGELHVLQGFTEAIAGLRSRIGRAFETKFIDALLADLRQHVQTVPAHDTMQRWANATYRNRSDHTKKSDSPAYMATNERLRPELQTALAGLSRAGYTSHAASAYRDAIMREIKSLIRRHLPSSTDDDIESATSISTSATARSNRKFNQQEKSAILARNLRALDPQDAEVLLVKVYTNVGEALRRLGIQVKVLLDVTSSIDSPKLDRKSTDPSKMKSSLQVMNDQASQIRDEVTQALDLSSLLSQAAEAVYNQVTKVLRVRTEQASHQPLQSFLRYFVLNRMFADECEAISSRSGDSLKEVVNTHVKEFLQRFAELQRQAINTRLEGDKWDAVDFDHNAQASLSRMLGGMTGTPSEWVGYTSLWNPSVANDRESNTILSITNGTSASEKARPALIDGQKYVMVKSTTTALSGIEDFQKLMVGIPYLSADVTARLLEYLRFFNSRCCQLILGAGATRSAGLKNITTKHLALASQVCSFIVALLPYIREFVRRAVPGSTGSMLPEFDKVKRLYQDHQSSIHDKLVEIMSQRCNAHISALKKVDFDKTSNDGNIPSTFVEGLSKETLTLHRVLSRHVPEAEVGMIMVPIFKHYIDEWSAALDMIEVRTDDGKQKLLRDVSYLDNRLSRLEGAGGFGKGLVDLVRAKKVSGSIKVSQTLVNAVSSGKQAEEMSSSEATEEKVSEEHKKDAVIESLPLTNDKEDRKK